MKLIIDTSQSPVPNNQASTHLTILLQNILIHQHEIEQIISTSARDFPLDKWISIHNITLHLTQESDGSRRTRRTITAYSYNKLNPTTDTRYFITIKPSRQ